MSCLLLQVAPPIPAKRRRKPPKVAFNDDKTAEAEAEAGEVGWGGAERGSELRQRSPKGVHDSEVTDDTDVRTNRTNVKAKLDQIHSEKLADDVVLAARKDVPKGVPSAPPLSDIWAVSPASPGEERSSSQDGNERLYENDDDDSYPEAGIESANSRARKSEHPGYEDYADEEDDDGEGGCGCGRRNEGGACCICVTCCGACEDTGGGCCASLHRPDGVGPMAKPRKRRDVLCMVLFVLCWILWIVLVWTTITDGCPEDCNDPRRLIYGADSHTNQLCGHGPMAHRPKLYFPFPENPKFKIGR